MEDLRFCHQVPRLSTWIATSSKYGFFFRHFIASLSDDLEYVERRVVVNMEGYNFNYIYHEITGGFFIFSFLTTIFPITERGFMTVTPWKLRSMSLNENRLHAGQLREGARVSIRNFDTVTEYTKAPDYLQVCVQVLWMVISCSWHS